jgi:uncharacterized protein
MTEIICWGIFFIFPFFALWTDASIELLILLLAGWGVWIWMNFIAPKLLITRHITLPKLKNHSLKIALISDLHAGPFKGVRFFKRVVKRINKEKPDLVLITGDFLLGTAQKFAKKLEPLKNICVPTFFTLGNHDHWVHNPNGTPAGTPFLRKKLKEWGLQELRNSAIKWKENLWLVGVDDNYHGFDDLNKAFERVPEIEESILLAHSPDIVDEFEKEKPALTVCGHTHGGQMAFPWLMKHVPDIMLHIARKEFIWGWFWNERMFVTMGLGESASRARWWACPEIVILNCIE